MVSLCVIKFPPITAAFKVDLLIIQVPRHIPKDPRINYTSESKQVSEKDSQNLRL